MRIRAFIAILLLAVLPALTSMPGAAAEFIFRDETGPLPGVTVWVRQNAADPNAGEVPLERKKLDDGGFGWVHEQSGAWIEQPSFTIRIPSRAKAGALKVNLSPMTVTLAFRIRSMWDRTKHVIPIKLIPNVDRHVIAEVEGMTLVDVHEKLILLAQLAQYRMKEDPGGDRTIALVSGWFNTILDALLYDRPDFRMGVTFDSGLKSAIMATFDADDEARVAFEARMREWQTMFWKIPKAELIDVFNAGRCEMFPAIFEFVRANNEIDPEAARDQGITDVEAQFQFMQDQFNERCDPATERRRVPVAANE